jgi:hypothetical protein
VFNCRRGCGACCVYLSLPKPFIGHPQGKPAGWTCNNLTKTWECGLYYTDLMPEVCREFKGSLLLCGKNFEEAKNGMIGLAKQTSKPMKEAAMGKGVIKMVALKKYRDLIDDYKNAIEDLMIKDGVAAVTVKSHYFYDTSTKTLPWSSADAIIRTSKSGATLGFHRIDHYVPEEHRSEHTFIIFVCDRGAVYGVSFLVTTLYEHWEMPVIENLSDEIALRRVLEVGLSTDQPYPELEQAKDTSSKWKTEDGYKDDLNLQEQGFLRDLVKGKLTPLQHEALFELADIHFGFVYTDLSSLGKARLWNILMDSEELGGEAVDPSIRTALQGYEKFAAVVAQ